MRCLLPIIRSVVAAACGALLALGPAAKAAPAFQSLYSFAPTDFVTGAYGVDTDAAGAIYGLGTRPNASQKCPDGCLVVFRLNPPASAGGAWTFEQIRILPYAYTASLAVSAAGDVYVLHFAHLFRFRKNGSRWVSTDLSPCAPDPYGRIVRAPDGSLYGISDQTIFKVNEDAVDPSKGCTVITSTFPFNRVNQYIAVSKSGTVYGTVVNYTKTGGGSIYRTFPAGGHTKIYGFDPALDPSGPIILGADGTLYGFAGQDPRHGPFRGTLVWSLSPAGVFTRIYQSDFSSPLVDLKKVGANLWVTGQNNDGAGVLLRLSPDPSGGAWHVTTAHTFAGPSGEPLHVTSIALRQGTLYGFDYPDQPKAGEAYSYGPLDAAPRPAGLH